jgi:putative ABC transport system permease protein
MRDQAMVIRTRPGAAQVVADEAPIATDPVNSDNYAATAPPDPRQLRTQVEASVEELFIVLAAVALVVSAFGIANTMLVSVIERRSEIGLRRAVGAQRRDIVVQFLLESGLTGLAGGVAGSCLGIVTVIAVSVTRTWTPVMPVGMVVAAPGLGMLTGMIAGLYPSVRAASVQPIEALRDQ